MSHYYEKTESGEIVPRHYVPMTTKDGTRPTRITDVRKWRKEGRIVEPSVTTVMAILDKPALRGWYVDQYLHTAYKDDGSAPFQDRNEEQYIKEIKRVTDLELEKAPEAGTEFHKDMQTYIESPSVLTGNHDLCQSTWMSIKGETGLNKANWAEHNFVSNGYGGQIDLVMIGESWIIDYKTKQTADKFKPGKMAYPENIRQLAAYRQAVSPKARCANVFVCLEDGQVDFHEHSEADLRKGWEVFSHCLGIWEINNL